MRTGETLRTQEWPFLSSYPRHLEGLHQQFSIDPTGDETLTLHIRDN